MNTNKGLNKLKKFPFLFFNTSYNQLCKCGTIFYDHNRATEGKLEKYKSMDLIRIMHLEASDSSIFTLHSLFHHTIDRFYVDVPFDIKISSSLFLPK